MHIEFLHDIKDPDTGELLYHKGQRVHRMTAVCAPYLDRKAAVEIKPARRGTRDWFTERMEQSAMPRQVHAADNSVVPPTLKAGWAVVTRDGPGGQQYFVQECRASGETFLYDGPPASAPATIVARYQELNGGDVDPAILQEAKRIAECEKNNRDAASKETETKNFHRIFGGK